MVTGPDHLGGILIETVHDGNLPHDGADGGDDFGGDIQDGFESCG